MARQAPCAALLLLGALAALLGVAHASVMAVGELQSCVNDGTTPSTSLYCTKKIVVTVEIENNRLYETEQLSFGVSCVDSPTGECPCPCNYAADASCKCRDLRQSITVAATKTPVYASYPLSYRQNFNGRPYEEVIEVPAPNLFGVGGCRAGERDQFPTCGWAKDPDTKADITYSQGFCCTCDDFDGSTSLKRSDISCAFLSKEESAHCLRFDDSWWHAGYMVGEFSIDFKINLNITTTTLVGNATAAPGAGGNATNPVPAATGSSSEVLSITPSVPFQRDASRRVSAKLLGDLASYRQEVQLEGKWLLIPFALEQYPNRSFLSSRRNEWMVVDPSMVSMDGSQCNKIGTSYGAFRNAQPNACSTYRGSCLDRQISHLYFEDLARMGSGQTPWYFVGRYGGGTANVDQVSAVMDAAGKLQLSLNLPLPGIRTSLLTLTVAADDVAFVVNRSPAEVVKVEVCTYDGRICGGFEAMTTRGYLSVDVRNSGYVASEYTVNVAECSAGAQRTSIAAQSVHRFSFEIEMETDEATNSSCTVSVTDSLGDVAARQGFTFYTNATRYDKPPEQPPNGDGEEPEGGPTPDWCQRVCPNILDLKCSALRGCFGRLSKGIATIAGPLFALAAAFFAWRAGYISLLLRILSALLCTGRRTAAPAPAGADSGRNQPQQGKRQDGQEEEQESKHGSRQRGGKKEATAEGDARLTLTVQPSSQKLPAATEPPAGAAASSADGGGGRAQRRRSSSFARARASIMAAAQQAREMLASMRFMMRNPAAAGGSKEAEAGELPERLRQVQQQRLQLQARLQQQQQR